MSACRCASTAASVKSGSRTLASSSSTSITAMPVYPKAPAQFVELIDRVRDEILGLISANYWTATVAEVASSRAARTSRCTLLTPCTAVFGLGHGGASQDGIQTFFLSESPRPDRYRVVCRIRATRMCESECDRGGGGGRPPSV